MSSVSGPGPNQQSGGVTPGQYILEAAQFEQALQNYSNSSNGTQQDAFLNVMNLAMLAMRHTAQTMGNPQLLQQHAQFEQDHAAFQQDPTSEKSKNSLKQDLTQAMLNVPKTPTSGAIPLPPLTQGPGTPLSSGDATPLPPLTQGPGTPLSGATSGGAIPLPPLTQGPGTPLSSGGATPLPPLTQGPGTPLSGATSGWARPLPPLTQGPGIPLSSGGARSLPPLTQGPGTPLSPVAATALPPLTQGPGTPIPVTPPPQEPGAAITAAVTPATPAPMAASAQYVLEAYQFQEALTSYSLAGNPGSKAYFAFVMSQLMQAMHQTAQNTESPQLLQQNVQIQQDFTSFQSDPTNTNALARLHAGLIRAQHFSPP